MDGSGFNLKLWAEIHLFSKMSVIYPEHVDSRKTKSTASALLDWFSTSARDLPWRRTRNPYAIWVSEIMLADTDGQVAVLHG